VVRHGVNYFSAQHVFEELCVLWKLPPLARTTILGKSTPDPTLKSICNATIGTGCFVQVLDGALPATAFGPLPVIAYVLVDFYKSLGCGEAYIYAYAACVGGMIAFAKRHMPRGWWDGDRSCVRKYSQLCEQFCEEFKDDLLTFGNVDSYTVEPLEQFYLKVLGV